MPLRWLFIFCFLCWTEEVDVEKRQFPLAPPETDVKHIVYGEKSPTSSQTLASVGSSINLSAS